MRDVRALAVVVVAVAVLVALTLWQTGMEPEVAGDVAPSALADDPPETGRAPTLEAGPPPAAPPPAAPSGAPPSPGEVELDGIRVEGRVVKGMGVPAVGAEVRVVPAAPGGTSVQTDAEGRFVVWALGVHPSTYGVATVLAHDDEGHAASKPVFLSQAVGNRFDAGVLTLSSGERLDVEVIAPSPGSLPAVVYVFREHADWLWLLAQGTTDAQGRFHAVGLPRGAVRIIARAEGTGRASVASYLPVKPAGPVRVELPLDRTVEVTIVSAATGEPVAGAVVDVVERYRTERTGGTRAFAPPLPTYVSDAEGRVELRGLGPGDSLCLFVQAEGYMPITGSAAQADHVNPFVAPDATSVRVELKPVRTIRWPLTEERGPLPDDGTTVRLAPLAARPGDTLPGEGRIEDGVLIATGFEPGSVRALAIEPGGRVAHLGCGHQSDEGRPTSFGAGSIVVVRVRRPDGSPATGVWVVVREGGGPGLMGEPTPVDEGGVARVGPLLGRFAEVYVAETPRSFGGDRVGTADLLRPVNEIDVILRGEREARLRVTVDGVSRVPDELVIELGSDENPLGGYERVLAERVEADGSVTFRWRPPPSRPSRPIQVRGRGTTRFGGRLFQDTSSGSDDLEVPLESAGALHVDIALPADGLVQPQLDRWDAVGERWVWTDFRGTSTPEPRPSGELVLEPLASGRYRLHDQVSGISLPPFELGTGEIKELAWDLSRGGIVSGRVEVPEGLPRHGIQLLLRDGDLPPGLAKRIAEDVVGGTGADGTFRVRVPGDRGVVLEPRHPTLVPARLGGRVTLREPRDGVVLRLERAATCRIALAHDVALPFHLRPRPRLPVRLFRGEPAGEPAFQIEAPLKDRVLEVGGYEPGRYTIWVDVLDAVPLVLRDVDLTGGDVDLGTHATEPGATVRLRLLVEEGAVVPRVGFWAQQDGPTGYTRGAISSGEDVITLTGLGPGTFRLRTSGQERPLPRNVDEVIESDGTGVIERTLDLR